MDELDLWNQSHCAAKAISGKTGERRREAISDFLRAAMVALLLG